MKKRVPLAIAAILTACGAVATTSNDAAESAPQGKSKAAQKQAQIGFPDISRGGMAGCFDPSLSGYARTQAERIGGVPCEQDQGKAGTDGDAWVGEYRGQMDGGPGTVVIVAGDEPNRYAVNFEVVQPGGCSGHVEGLGAAITNDRMKFFALIPEENRLCRMEIVRSGSTLRTTEGEGCSYFHGMSCEFGGRLTRVGASAAAPKAAPAPAAPWIVGAWAASRVNCMGNGASFQSDGTYFAVNESGTWRLAGTTLTLVATHETDGESDFPLSQPRRTSIRVLSLPGGQMSWRVGNRPTVVMVRCPAN